MIFIVLGVVIYVFSAIAVGVWHEIVRGTSKMSWVDDKQIFTPVYNTIIAINLWSNFNPFRNK